MRDVLEADKILNSKIKNKLMVLFGLLMSQRKKTLKKSKAKTG